MDEPSKLGSAEYSTQHQCHHPHHRHHLGQAGGAAPPAEQSPGAAPTETVVSDALSSPRQPVPSPKCFIM